MIRLACLACATVLLASAQASATQHEDTALVRIAVLSQLKDRPPALSNLDPPPEDRGLLGARMAAEDNNTTGRFTKQRFEITERLMPADGDAVKAFKALAADGHRFFVVNLDAATLLRVADLPGAKDALIFNAGAADDRLRNGDCRANVLHTSPSRAMMADALAQYLAWKRWTRWFLVIGNDDADKLYAAAIRRAAKRFGGKIVAEKEWTFGPDARRSAQSQVPVFTQDVDYDTLIVADEEGEFGEYLIYRTWVPKLVAGTQGLVPTSWHRAHEQWGAVQLQNRFLRAYMRRMTPVDFNAWAAVRTIGEAATRTRSVEFESISRYIRSDAFELAAFKGQKLTFRSWNGQLRQPILLAAPRSLVSVSPQKGFLHQRSYLDTLGYDEPESKCRFD